jgi:hypothetical protein
LSATNRALVGATAKPLVAAAAVTAVVTVTGRGRRQHECSKKRFEDRCWSK